jgi:phosphatidylglycerol:prolipoprotein diacylglycerol transferase
MGLHAGPWFPYFAQPRLDIGPLHVHAFGVLVAVGILVGVEVTQRRARFEGLDPRVMRGVIGQALLWGFVAAHVLDVVCYSPQRLLDHPSILLRFWEGISSYGGMLGGLAGMAVYLGSRRRGLDAALRWRHVDAAAYGWPFAWVFGRLACTVATDHPGTVTRGFVLATRLDTPEARELVRGFYASAGRGGELPGDAALAGMGFHNLGFYELLWTLLVIVPVFLWLGRSRRPPAFFLVAFTVLYAPARFVLDVPRVTDATYLGLTPGQYASAAALLAAGAALWLRGAASRLRDAARDARSRA